MSRQPPPFAHFLHELKRRRVVRVALIYLASGFAVVEAIDIMAAALSFPEWLLQAALAVLAVGLPVALVLSWVYDLTPEGVVQTGESEPVSEAGLTAGAGGGGWLSPGSVGIAFLLVLAGAGATWLFESMVDRTRPADVPPNSIAVLPFEASADPSFADGLHEDLLTQLGRLSGVRVISRASVLEYRDRDISIDEIARELGVSTLLLGTVRRADDRVRVNVELVDPATQESRWADSYDRTVIDVFDIQEDIATNITDALEATLTSSEKARLSDRPTESVEAYEHFVRGAEMLTRAVQRLDPTGLDASISLLGDAIAIDPGFALAHAYASLAYEWSQRAATSEDDGAPYGERALEFAREAMRLDESLPEAAFVMAFQNSARPGDRARTAEDVRLLEQALSGAPNNAAAMREMALRLERLGRVEEAVTYSMEAAQREPRSALYQLQAADHLRLTRDFAAAEGRLDVAFSLSALGPITDVLYRMRILLQLAQGDVDGARTTFSDEVINTPLTPAAMGVRLATFPELIRLEEHAQLVTELSVSADDAERRCSCFAAKAWVSQLDGETASAAAWWDSVAVELAATEYPDAAAEALGTAQLVWALGQAGRTAEARASLDRLEGMPPDVLEVPSQAMGRFWWQDIRVSRAAAYASIGDAGAAVQILGELLDGPSGITPEYLANRLRWDGIRTDPAFASLLQR